MIRHLPILLLATPLGAAQLLTNPDFEAAAFATGWTSTAATQTTGLNGTAKAARLPYQTNASLSQLAATAAPDFTLDLCFQTPGINEAQSFRMTVLAGGKDAIELRLATNGVLELGTAPFSLFPLTALADGAKTAIPINQTVKVRIIGRGFGTAAADYDVLWTAPYTGSAVPAFTRAALGLKSFLTLPSAGANGVRFERNVYNANSFVVDQLALEDSAAAPGLAATHQLVLPPPDKVVEISGVYPHLAMTNTHAECGVGAVVPWAGKLWVITYGPHIPNGGTDRLYEIAPDLSRAIRAESVGGTPANRFIHTASNQLNIGPYFIDGDRNVRVLRNAGTNAVIPGRITATAAHLTDPNRLYLFTMEDGLYDVNATDLSYITRYPDVQTGGDRMLFGYHGKGAYTGQGRLAVANNGRVNNQSVPTGEAGVLATWNGTTVAGNGGAYFSTNAANADEPSGNPAAAQPDYLAGWKQISKTQHCEVTGPGGIYGNPNPATDPVWSTGFDAKSVMLHVMEGGEWKLWRLPKASYTHDGSHGWHTEWPRIRQLDPANPASPYLMHMHGLFFDFPKTFSAANFAGLKVISSYYKMPTDYATFFDGRIVMGKADASQFDNPLALKDQSNLWFGTMEDIKNWGPATGHGAVWLNEAVAAGQVSDPFFIDGFPQRTLHLRNAGPADVTIQLETSQGTPEWTASRSVTVPANGYMAEIVSDLTAPWVRLKTAQAATGLTAFFHMGSPYNHATPASRHSDEFAALADIRDTRSVSDGIVRVMSDPSLPLEFASSRLSASGTGSPHRYHRIGGDMKLADVADTTAETALRTNAATSQTYQSDGGLTFTTGSDEASAFIRQGTTATFRVPKTDPLYEAPFAAGWARTAREAVTERQLLNFHGTFFEYPRDVSGGVRKMRALATHGKRITDFTSWRGLFVCTGVLDDAPASNHVVRNPDGSAALWLGEIDDLWRMGEPRGTGGPWNNTAVTAGTPSDPYLMYGYNRKELTLSATSATTVTVEVDFLADNTWSVYRSFDLAAGESISHVFPEGFHAHWVRVRSSAATTATARFVYGPADVRDAFLDWSRERGLPTGSGRAAVAQADPDGDHIPNFAEYLLGSDPASANPWPGLAATDGMTVNLRNPGSDDGLHATFESSTDLKEWRERNDLAAPAADQSGVPAGFTRHLFRFDTRAETNRFVRLRLDLD